MDKITLIDDTTGRRAPCAVRSFGEWGGASEIDADALRDWARRARCVRRVDRALKRAAAGDIRAFDEFDLVTASEFCCGLLVRDDNDARAVWVRDCYEVEGGAE